MYIYIHRFTGILSIPFQSFGCLASLIANARVGTLSFEPSSRFELNKSIFKQKSTVRIPSFKRVQLGDGGSLRGNSPKISCFGPLVP